MSTDDQEIILPPITFEAGGENVDASVANLEAVLPSPGYPEAAFLIADALAKRADVVVLDYTPNAVAVRYQIDGVWHNLPPRDRQSGDFMLASLKKLSDLDYTERRKRQEGTFKTKFRNEKSDCRLVSQGIKTGERVAIYTGRPKPDLETLSQIGMRPKTQDRLIEMMSRPTGLVLISSLPEDGLSTLWRAALHECDRLTRDYVVFEDANDPEPEIINVTSEQYDSAKDQTPLDIMRDVMLREPDVLCFPDLCNAEVINTMCDQVIEENKLVIARVHAKSAAEALLRVLVHRCDLKKFAQAITCSVNGRLARRLCETCKIPFAPAPQLLQKMGIPQGRIEAFYSKYQPPPEGSVDEHGNPIQVHICPDCENIGFVERFGFFEMLEVNDKVRSTLKKSPDMNSLAKAAKASGEVALRDEGILMVAKGLTSIDELQRVLKK